MNSADTKIMKSAPLSEQCPLHHLIAHPNSETGRLQLGTCMLETPEVALVTEVLALVTEVVALPVTEVVALPVTEVVALPVTEMLVLVTEVAALVVLEVVGVLETEVATVDLVGSDWLGGSESCAAATIHR